MHPVESRRSPETPGTKRRTVVEILLSIVYLVLLVVLIGRSDDGRSRVPRFKPDTRDDFAEPDRPVRNSAPPEKRAA